MNASEMDREILRLRGSILRANFLKPSGWTVADAVSAMQIIDTLQGQVQALKLT
jgi:plasmid maintenance system antidote protein VapI